MKPISLLSILVALPVLVLAYLNYSNVIQFTIIQDKFSLSLAYILVVAFIDGVLAGFLFLYGYLRDSNFKLKEYQRKLEKTSVSADCDSSKVAVLEAKIEVLEKALKSALDKN